MCFSPYFGYWVSGGGFRGLVHRMLMQSSSLRSSKIKVSDEPFFVLYIVTTKNDHPIYVKHGLGRIYVFFTLLWY